jgi:hypothetical protein
MPGKSDFLENQVLNSTLRATAWPAWTTGSHYVALWVGDPTDAGSGGAEVSGGAYARVPVARASGSWAAPADSSGSQLTSNVAAVTFPAPTANWGTVTHFAVMDAITGGNMLYSGALAASRTINNGDGAPSFAAGALTISEG